MSVFTSPLSRPPFVCVSLWLLVSQMRYTVEQCLSVATQQWRKVLATKGTQATINALESGKPHRFRIIAINGVRAFKCLPKRYNHKQLLEKGVCTQSWIGLNLTFLFFFQNTLFHVKNGCVLLLISSVH